MSLSLHKRLQEQLDRHLGGQAAIPESWLPLLEDISRCYSEADAGKANGQIRQVGEMLMKSASDLIFLKDEHFRYLLTNPANNAFMGKTEEEIIGHTDFDLMPRDAAEHCRASDQRALEEGQRILTEESVGAETYEVLKFPVSLSNGRIGVGAAIRNITSSRRLQHALEEINRELLEMGLDYTENIRRLTEICGKQLQADCALYNRLNGKMLCSVGHWHVPPDFNPEDPPEGHICYDVIRKGSREPSIIRCLQDTPYARTDPNVAKYALQTYWGQAVRCGNGMVGSLCVAFQDDREATKEDLRILEILTSFISQEEERQQAATSLRESEERMRSIFMASPDGIVILATDGRICLNSPGVPDLFGYPRGTDLTGKPAFDFLVPEDRERATNNLMLLFQNQQHGPIEYQGVRADGTVFSIEVNAQAIPAAETQAQQALVIVRDITERKQAEAALLQSEQHHRAYLQHSPYGIFVADQNGKYLQVNPAACRTTGYTEKELLGMSIADLQFEEDMENAMRHFHTLLDTGRSSGDVPFRHKSGKRRWWHVSAVKISDTRCLGFCNDITEQKQAEQQILSLSKFPAENPNPVLRIRRDGLILYSNPPGENLLSMWNTRVGGQMPNEWKQRIQRIFDSPFEPEQEEIRCGQILYSAAITPVPEEDYVNIYASDITLQKQVEAALRKSEARQSAAQEMAHIGHWEYDIDSDTFTFNDNFYRIFKTTAEEMGGYQMSSADYANRFCHPDDRAMVRQETQAAILADDPDFHRQIEHRILYADGTQGYIAVRFSIVKDPQGRTIRTYGVNQDITAYKKTEEALRESRQITEGILDSMPVRVFWKGKDLKYQGCNQAFARDAGLFAPEDVAGKDDTQLNWKHHAGLYQMEDREVLQTGEPKLLYEVQHTTPEGKELILLSSKIPMHDAKGCITGILGTYMDITEHREAEKRLKQSHALQQAIAANIPGAVYQLRLQANGFPVVAYMSSGCEKLFEHPLKGMDYSALWFDNMPPDDLTAFRQSISQAARNMQRWSMEFRIIRPNGEIKWLRGSANPQKDSKGQVLWNGVLLDITERRLAEEGLEKQLDELRRWQRATLGRENRILELKREVNALSARLKQTPPYNSATDSL